MTDEYHHIFCDESRQTSERFMVLGGIIIARSNVAPFNRTMQAYRKKFNMTSELKWNKVKRQKLDEYKGFVDYFFALLNNDKIHFKCMIVDNHAMDHRKYNEKSKEIGFQKMYYQMLLHCFGIKYYKEFGCEKFFLYPDQRHSKSRLEDLRTFLNRGIRKHGISTNPFVHIEAVDSKKSEIMQINDIILGAVGYHKNGVHLLSDASEGKKELAQHILNHTGYKNITDNTPYNIHRFTIWNFRLRK